MRMIVYDVVEWCKSKIMSKKADISKRGKNWYICIEGCIITVNASSYTIITAHKEKRSLRWNDRSLIK